MRNLSLCVGLEYTVCDAAGNLSVCLGVVYPSVCGTVGRVSVRGRLLVRCLRVTWSVCKIMLADRFRAEHFRYKPLDCLLPLLYKNRSHPKLSPLKRTQPFSFLVLTDSSPYTRDSTHMILTHGGKGYSQHLQTLL